MWRTVEERALKMTGGIHWDAGYRSSVVKAWSLDKTEHQALVSIIDKIGGKCLRYIRAPSENLECWWYISLISGELRRVMTYLKAPGRLC